MVQKQPCECDSSQATGHSKGKHHCIQPTLMERLEISNQQLPVTPSWSTIKYMGCRSSRIITLTTRKRLPCVGEYPRSCTRGNPHTFKLKNSVTPRKILLGFPHRVNDLVDDDSPGLGRPAGPPTLRLYETQTYQTSTREVDGVRRPLPTLGEGLD